MVVPTQSKQRGGGGVVGAWGGAHVSTRSTGNQSCCERAAPIPRTADSVLGGRRSDVINLSRQDHTMLGQEGEAMPRTTLLGAKLGNTLLQSKVGAMVGHGRASTKQTESALD